MNTNKYANLQEKFINIGGYEIDTHINKIINGFKLNDLINKKYAFFRKI